MSQAHAALRDLPAEAFIAILGQMPDLTSLRNILLSCLAFVSGYRTNSRSVLLRRLHNSYIAYGAPLRLPWQISRLKSFDTDEPQNDARAKGMVDD